jgi:ADP-ribosylglycohydrolase
MASRSERGPQLKTDERKAAVVSSALWAAAGDALGWMTELADQRTVSYRTGAAQVRTTVDWRRRIGGRFGPTVRLPAGTYSDDTQLRLAVSRAIRGTGQFDVEAFAKVELPVWLSYSLGAGRGTTAAANNLAKPSVTWFSNFFSSKDSRGYFSAGGNGAAMRIQPHVWRSKSLRFDDFISDVLKDAITTHGHPVGFCGAVFHALSVAYSLEYGRPPVLDDWKDFIGQFDQLSKVVKRDEHLGLFWLGPWEERFGSTFEKAVEAEAKRCLSLVNELQLPVQEGPRGYSDILRKLGGFDEATRGSGTNTVIAAAALALCGLSLPIEDVVCLGANEIGSDTDTISSMAGAILGCIQGGEPSWKLQDRSYLISEAARMADIATDAKVASFQYPDLMGWDPPTTHGDAVGTTGKTLWVAGLGKAEPVGEVWSGADAGWQWLQLEFGQTVLAKRRLTPRGLSKADLPAESVRASSARNRSRSSEEPTLFSDASHIANPGSASRTQGKSAEQPASSSGVDTNRSIDDLAAWAIAESFRADVVGEALLLAARGPNAIDRSIALAAVIAKAIDARRRRSTK